jgi:hypothetical protein
MPESFQVIFNSRGPNVINNASLNAVQYNVTWGAFLPTKFQKFHCQFVFKSENYNGVLVNNGFVNLNTGKMNIYMNGNSFSNNLGIIYPVVTSANSSYYNSTNNDNNDFWISYPSNNLITITLNEFDGVTPMPNMPNYVMILNLVGVANDDLNINNT